MYESVILSTFFISWSFERIYYYCYHKNNNNSILNLNTPLDNSNQARYYEINSLNNSSNENSNDNSNSNNSNDSSNKRPTNNTLL